MKTFLLCLLVLGSITTSFNSHAAATLFCSVLSSTEDPGTNSLLLLRENVTEMECFKPEISSDSTTGIAKGEEYFVTIQGFGLGLRATNVEVLTIFCPTVRARALGVETFINKRGKEKKGTSKFFGIKATAGVVIGADAAVFANNKGGICALAGFQVGSFGAAVSAPKMTIKRKSW